MTTTNSNKNFTLQICLGPRCMERQSRLVMERAKNDLAFYNIDNVKIEHSGCQGGCKEGPMVKVINDQSGEVQSLNYVRATNISEKLKHIKNHGKP